MVWANFSLLSIVQPATCGDKITFSNLRSLERSCGISEENKLSKDIVTNCQKKSSSSYCKILTRKVTFYQVR